MGDEAVAPDDWKVKNPDLDPVFWQLNVNGEEIEAFVCGKAIEKLGKANEKEKRKEDEITKLTFSSYAIAAIEWLYRHKMISGNGLGDNAGVGEVRRESVRKGPLVKG